MSISSVALNDWRSAAAGGTISGSLRSARIPRIAAGSRGTSPALPCRVHDCLRPSHEWPEIVWQASGVGGGWPLPFFSRCRGGFTRLWPEFQYSVANLRRNIFVDFEVILNLLFYIG